MVRTAIRDIEAIRAQLPLEQRRHSEVVLRHLNLALSDMIPAEGATVIRFELAALRARRAAPEPRAPGP
jgi:hypothetical protein